MRGRQSAEKGKSSNGAKAPIQSEIAAPLTASSQARLEYIAEMVHELKIMSDQADCEVLADLLERERHLLAELSPQDRDNLAGMLRRLLSPFEA